MRVLLRDGNTGAATSSRIYQDSDIISALYDARAELCQALIESKTMTESQNIVKMKSPSYPRFSISRLLKSVNVTATAQNVPTDFWRLEAGAVTATSKYVQAETAFQADSLLLAPQMQTYLYTRNGKFYAATTPVTAYYWALPTSTIDNTGALFTDFNDGFYLTAVYLAYKTLLQIERGDDIARYNFAGEMFAARINTLR